MAANAQEYLVNPKKKPPYSYATLICLAMHANDNKITLSSIYAWIRENFMYYQTADPTWQVALIIIFFFNLVSIYILTQFILSQ